jgi:four helix bundle protein
MELGKLDIYKLSVELSNMAWEIFNLLQKPLQFNIGDQMIRSIDSIGANIAEGYGRFHYKDSIKFYYNARGSLWESKHWFYLLHKRKLITRETFEKGIDLLNTLGKKLNSFIQRIKQNEGIKK